MIKLILNPNEPDQQEIPVHVCEGDIEFVMGIDKGDRLPSKPVQFRKLVHKAAMQMVLSNKVATSVGAASWVLIDDKYEIVIGSRRCEPFDSGDSF